MPSPRLGKRILTPSRKRPTAIKHANFPYPLLATLPTQCLSLLLTPALPFFPYPSAPSSPSPSLANRACHIPILPHTLLRVLRKPAINHRLNPATHHPIITQTVARHTCNVTSLLSAVDFTFFIFLCIQNLNRYLLCFSFHPRDHNVTSSKS